MTREQMVKIAFKPYMRLEYKTDRMEFPILCMLIGVDFDTELFKLCPLDTEMYEAVDVWIPVQHVYIPRPQPRKVK